MKKNQIKKTTSGFEVKERENFIAFINDNDPELYQVAIEKGWINSILDDLGVGYKKPAHANISTKNK